MKVRQQKLKRPPLHECCREAEARRGVARGAVPVVVSEVERRWVAVCR